MKLIVMSEIELKTKLSLSVFLLRSRLTEISEANKLNPALTVFPVAISENINTLKISQKPNLLSNHRCLSCVLKT